MAEGDGQQVEWLDELVGLITGWHDRIIGETGGLTGVHAARLYSACARPFQTVLGEDAYPTTVDKVAALVHALVRDHPFVDGNKRTATIAAVFFLVGLGYLAGGPTPLQVRLLGDVAVETATGGLDVTDVLHWIERIFAP